MFSDSMHAAVSFVSINAGLLLSCLPAARRGGGKGDHPVLYNKYTDIMVALGELDVIREGPSASACAALSIIIAMGRCDMLLPQTGITGDMDLRGRVHVVGGLNAKIQYAMNDGMDLV